MRDAVANAPDARMRVGRVEPAERPWRISGKSVASERQVNGIGEGTYA
jgi:hypothetical protein